jgi:fatty acid desaturase
MTGQPRRRVEVRALDDATRKRSTRSLFLATAVCDALLVAIVLIGLSSGWLWWVLVATGLLPFLVGLYALRAIFVLNRRQSSA